MRGKQRWKGIRVVLLCTSIGWGVAAFAGTQPPVIKQQPVSRTNNAGTTATFTIKDTGNSATYQWYKEGSNRLSNGGKISGVTTTTLSIANVLGAERGNYHVVVRNAAATVTSSIATLWVLDPNITSPPVSRTNNSGTTATFTVAANGTSPIRYQWLQDSVPIAGATGATYAIASVDQADSGAYSVVVSNSFGVITSSPAALTVLSPPVIITHPLSQALEAGSTAIFKVAATGSPATYRWYVINNRTNLLNNGGKISGATTAILTITNVLGADRASYFAVISNSVDIVASSNATLGVTDPVITRPPDSCTTVSGAAASFTGAAYGTAPLAYQWLKNGERLAGATNATYSIARVTPDDAADFCVVAVNAFGAITSSPPATLTVMEPPLIINPPQSQTNSAGATATFTVAVTGTAPLFYQWFKNESPLNDEGNISGTASSSLTLANVSSVDVAAYFVVVTNAAGAVTSAPPATLTVVQIHAVLSVTSSKNPSGFRDRIWFTAELPVGATGEVTFKTNDEAFEAVPLIVGQATSTATALLPRGMVTITAEYVGDGKYAGNTNGFTQTVTNHPPFAAPMTVWRTPGAPLVIRLLDVATNWSDTDGDFVTLDGLCLAATNGADLLINRSWFPEPDQLPRHYPETNSNTDEIWISTNPVTANLGTVDQPFDGSTAQKFDAICGSVPPNTTIHLMPGKFQTGGNARWHLNSGQKLRGSGIDITVLQLADTNTANWVVGSHYACTNMEVADLTLDANGTPDMKFTRCGVFLGGTQNAVRRIKVINCVTGNPQVSEGWGIVLESWFWNGPSDGNVIEDSEVSSYQGPIYTGDNTGGYFANLYAIDLHGGANSPITGIIRNNRIIVSPATPVFGIGFGRAHDVLIESNYLEGVGVGTHIENSDVMTNIIIQHNRFIGCTALVDFSYNHAHNIAYLSNDIELTNGLYNFAVGFVFVDNGAYTNIVICGNRIRCTSTPDSGKNELIEAGNIDGLLVASNTVDPRLTNHLVNCQNVFAYSNVDFAGNSLTSLNCPPPSHAPIAGDDLLVLGGNILYINNQDAPDQIRYQICDGQGGNRTGLIHVAMAAPYSGGNTSPPPVVNFPLLTFEGTPGRDYVLERTTSLAGPAWVAIDTNQVPANGIIKVADGFSDLGAPPPSAFYRLVWRRKAKHALVTWQTFPAPKTHFQIPRGIASLPMKNLLV